MCGLVSGQLIGSPLVAGSRELTRHADSALPAGWRDIILFYSRHAVAAAARPPGRAPNGHVPEAVGLGAAVAETRLDQHGVGVVPAPCASSLGQHGVGVVPAPCMTSRNCNVSHAGRTAGYQTGMGNWWQQTCLCSAACQSALTIAVVSRGVRTSLSGHECLRRPTISTLRPGVSMAADGALDASVGRCASTSDVDTCTQLRVASTF